MKKEERIALFMEKCYISREEAEELYEFDIQVDKTNKPTEGEIIVEKVTRTAKKGITEEELVEMLEVLKATFFDKKFKNSDLNDVRAVMDLSARQTPSRLKKLVEQGELEDLGGSPKSYCLRKG